MIKLSSSYKLFISLSLVISLLLNGCTASMIRALNDQPSFDKGMKSLNERDFEKSSFYFAELAKDGIPAAMNNLGLSLMMVNRKDEAIYWFKQAVIYGDDTAKGNLIGLGEEVPNYSLAGLHQSDINRIENQEFISNLFIAALVGISLGVSMRYQAQQTSMPSQYRYNSLNNASNVKSNPIIAPKIHNKSSNFINRGTDSVVNKSHFDTGRATLCPDGSYVSGTSCYMTPKGTYVGGSSATLCPDGSYVSGGNCYMTPKGTYVGSSTATICPDGSYVSGRNCYMTPKGTYVGY